MAKPKFDRKELHRLLYAEGKKPAEIAKMFGVTKGAISQAIKDLKQRTTKVLAINEGEKKPKLSKADSPAGEVVKLNINAAADLNLVNAYAKEMLHQLMAWQRGDEVAIQIMESQKRTVRIRGAKETITDYHFKDPRELTIRLMGEIREQVMTQLKIYSTLYDMEAFKQFKEAFLDSIGKVSPELREQVIAQLQKDRLLPTGF